MLKKMCPKFACTNMYVTGDHGCLNRSGVENPRVSTAHLKGSRPSTLIARKTTKFAMRSRLTQRVSE